MGAEGGDRGSGVLEAAGEVVAASIRAHPLLWGVVAAVLVSTPLWAPPATAALSVAAAASAVLRLPLAPRRVLCGPWAWALLLIPAAVAGWADADRPRELPWRVQCGLSVAAALLLAVAVAHASRAPRALDPDAALVRVVASLRRAPVTVAAFAFLGAVPMESTIRTACYALDVSHVERFGHGGAAALVGSESISGAWPVVMLLATTLGSAPVGRSLFACITGLLLASVACSVAVDAAHSSDPWDEFEGWRAHAFPVFALEVLGLALSFLVRGVRVVGSRSLGRWLALLLLAFWVCVRVGADVPHTWWSSYEPVVSLDYVFAGILVTGAQVAVMTAALMIPLRSGTLVAVAVAQAALTSVWAGSVCETPQLGWEAAPIAAAGGAVDAGVVLGARHVRRVLGVGLPREPEHEDPDEDLSWAAVTTSEDDRPAV